MAQSRSIAVLFLCALIAGCSADGTTAMKSDEVGSLYAQTPRTEQFFAKKNKQDYDFQETIAKANQQTIAKA